MSIIKGAGMENYLSNGIGSGTIAVLEDWADPDADIADMIVDGSVATVKGAVTGMAIKTAGTALAATSVGSALIGTGTAMASGLATAGTAAVATAGAAAAATAGVAFAAAPVIVVGGLIGGLFGLFD